MTQYLQKPAEQPRGQIRARWKWTSDAEKLAMVAISRETAEQSDAKKISVSDAEKP